MNPQQSIAFALWLVNHYDRLVGLFKDFDHTRLHPPEKKENAFLRFAQDSFMRTVHFADEKPTLGNLIEISVICSGDCVQSVYSNVSGRFCSVDIVDLDVKDDALAESALKESKRLENLRNKIF